MAYDLNAIRKKIADAAGKKSDPLEFKPKKVADGEVMSYRFYVLPPLSKGDKCVGGSASKDMEMYTIANGAHWINNRPYGCPRTLNGDSCPVCDQGFKLLNEVPKEDEGTRTKIKREFMPASYHMVNIYFTDSKSNPEELRGQVRYFSAPHTCYKLWNDAISRDTCGDEDDPQAYGVFFDENAAFLFQLQVTKNGQNNSYVQSKFIVKDMPRPIADSKAEIKDILSRRVDLFTKLYDVDTASLNKALNLMINGDDSGDDSGFDEDDTKPRKTNVQESRDQASDKKKDRLAAEEAVSSKKEKVQAKPQVDEDDEGDIDDEVDKLMAGMDDDDDE